VNLTGILTSEGEHMTRYFAFLRAINVGGHTVKMEDLREIFNGLGFSKVETFIASGNVIFESGAQDSKLLEKKIAAQLNKSLGYEVATFIRTDSEFARLASHQAFPQSEIASAAAFNVAFLSSALDESSKKKLKSLASDIDSFSTHEREVYWLCQKKQSESKFSNAVLEKTLGIQSTLRGINTVRKMAEKYTK
jgi:uncharacterized protein (DUF1697 family)